MSFSSINLPPQQNIARVPLKLNVRESKAELVATEPQQTTAETQQCLLTATGLEHDGHLEALRQDTAQTASQVLMAVLVAAVAVVGVGVLKL